MRRSSSSDVAVPSGVFVSPPVVVRQSLGALSRKSSKRW
jgi:hypothetical protein